MMKTIIIIIIIYGLMALRSRYSSRGHFKLECHVNMERISKGYLGIFIIYMIIKK